MEFCRGPECTNAVKYVALRLCGAHYKQLWAGKDLRPLKSKVCAVVTCNSPTYRYNASKCAEHRGVCVYTYCDRSSLNDRGQDSKTCAFHRQRARQGIPPDQELIVYGDNWYLKNGYEVRDVKKNGKKRTILHHREVMEKILGRPLLQHENVHHMNGNRADNRPENLELWNTSQPAGQRIEDKLRWAHELIDFYEGTKDAKS
jgi:hypothetical protein